MYLSLPLTSLSYEKPHDKKIRKPIIAPREFGALFIARQSNIVLPIRCALFLMQDVSNESIIRVSEEL